MDKKICKKCNLELLIKNFSKESRQKDGYRIYCKGCIKELMYFKKYYKNNNNKNKTKEYYRNNKDEILEQSKQYYKDNKTKINNYHKKYRNKNQIKIKQYYKDNKEKILKDRKEYYKNNRENIITKNTYYRYNRLKIDDLYKLRCYIRTMLYNSLKNNGFTKKSKSFKILGCTFKELKQYLESKFESWMTWKNYGKYNGELNYGWDIDHIIPISSVKTEEEIIKLNHFSNLQPLCSKINRDIKRDSLDF